MTTITILPERTDSYRAVAGDKESTGRTAGEALDAITLQLEDEESGMLVIMLNHEVGISLREAGDRIKPGVER